MKKNFLKTKITSVINESDKEKIYKGPFCCSVADIIITKKKGPLHYYPKTRRYLLDIINDYAMALAIYCPWCGTELPKSLAEQWHVILETEYGIEDPDLPRNAHKVPAEFKTDEWWKKRGDSALKNIKREERYDPVLDEIHKKIEIEHKNYNGPFCCYTTHNQIEDNDSPYEDPLQYDSKSKVYSLDILNTQERAPIFYCPWCGKKFTFFK